MTIRTTSTAACPAGGAHEWHLGAMQQGGATAGRCAKCGVDRLFPPDPLRFMPGHPSRRGRPKGVTR